jgi:ElaB/YqjD/DUF883 family membrane-anchored ribosome-binding protein
MLSSPVKDTDTINLKDASHEAGETLRNAAHNTGRKLRGMINTASEEISHAGECVSEEIRSNPVRSGVIALGVGVLIGALLRR